MKFPSFLICAGFAIFHSSLASAETPGVEAAASPTTARILGQIPDGTPPPPEPPKPGFIVPTRDILKTETHWQGGRTITVQQIKPIALPAPAKPIAPPDPADPTIQERITTAQRAHPEQEFLFVGATVFRAKNATVRSFVTLSPLGRAQPITVWSSADFALLSGFSSFIGSDGEDHSLIMAWGTTEIEAISDIPTQRGFDFGLSKIPELPPGKATFVVLFDHPDPATLASIQSLHDLYNNEHDRLLCAYQGRERARLQHEAELKANPTQPKNIVLNHWRTQSPAKGDTK